MWKESNVSCENEPIWAIKKHVNKIILSIYSALDMEETSSLSTSQCIWDVNCRLFQVWSKHKTSSFIYLYNTHAE